MILWYNLYIRLRKDIRLIMNKKNDFTVFTMNTKDAIDEFLNQNRKKKISVRIYTKTRSYLGNWFDIDRNFLLVEESDMNYRRIKLNSIGKIKQYVESKRG